MKTRNFFFLMSVLVLAFTSCSKSDDDEPKNEGANGHQIEITEYVWKFGEKPTYGELYERYTYNANNKIVKAETNHYLNSQFGRIPHEITYTYNEKNQLVEKNEYQLTLLNYRYKYTSNNIDSVATMQKYNNKGSLSESWTYNYDSQKRLIKATETKGIIPYEDEYTYGNNQLTIVRHRYDNGELFGTTIYDYDSHNNLVQKTWISGSTGKEDLEIWNEYEYNSNGSIKKLTIHGYIITTDLTYKDYTYNSDGSIHNIHVSYSFKDDVSDLEYSYTKL